MLGLPAAAPAADAGACGAPAQVTRDRPQPVAGDADVAAIAAEAAAAFGAGSEDDGQGSEDQDGGVAAAGGAAWEVGPAGAVLLRHRKLRIAGWWVFGVFTCMSVLSAASMHREAQPQDEPERVQDRQCLYSLNRHLLHRHNDYTVGFGPCMFLLVGKPR